MVWPVAEPWLRQIARRIGSEVTAESIHHGVRERRQKLWLIYDSDAPTEVIASGASSMDGEARCHIEALCGSGIAVWGREVLGEFEALAKAHGALCIRFEGRPGWSRVLPGYAVTARNGDTWTFERTL